MNGRDSDDETPPECGESVGESPNELGSARDPLDRPMDGDRIQAAVAQTTPAPAESAGQRSVGWRRILQPGYGGRVVSRLRPNRDTDFERVRSEYGYIRAYYRVREEQHKNLQRWLNQAEFGVNFDVYLSRIAIYTIFVSLLGAGLGILATWGLVELGIVAELRNPFSIRGSVTQYLGANRTLFVGAITMALGSGLIGALTWYGLYHRPAWVASRRRRNIDIALPHAIVFMYALSEGGRDLIDIFSSLADAEGTYGEISDEFDYVVRDVEVFGNDLQTSLQNTRDLTPSDNLKQFLDDLLGVIDSGGDVTTFLQEESDRYLEDARTEQESFLETLALMSEFFITLFVAAPLFFVVMLLVMSLLGGETIGMVALLVYVLLPLGVVGFLLLIDILNAPFVQPAAMLDAGEDTDIFTDITFSTIARAAIGTVTTRIDRLRNVGEPTDEAVARSHYIRRRRIAAVRGVLSEPTVHFRKKPLHTLALTLPIAGIIVATLVQSATITPGTFDTEPIKATAWLFVLPGLVVLMPLSYYVERENRRERHVTQSFPDVLNVLASANRMGVSTTDAIGFVSRWTGGRLGDELRYLRQDIEWNYDVSGGFIRFANRLSVPPLSRAMKLVSEGLHSTSDVSRVLRIAADDARTRAKLLRQRRDQLSTYVIIVLVSFLVYLLVILMLDIGYLRPIADISADQPADVPGIPGSPITVTNLPVTQYKLLFFHSGLIQAMGSGLLAGKLSTNRSLTGLKYSIAMIIVATATFLLI